MEQDAARNLGLIALCSVLSLLTGATIVYFSLQGREPAAPIIISTPLPTATSHPTSTPAPLRVYVSGAVVDPAVCELAPGSIVQDAIDAVGGPTSDADLTSLNLALELRDQQHVHVPGKGEAGAPPVISGGAPQSEMALVNVNTAGARELETLPGVGEVTAQRIIAYREANGPFKAVEEIQNVSGIGPKTFERMRDRITVQR